VAGGRHNGRSWEGAQDDLQRAQLVLLLRIDTLGVGPSAVVDLLRVQEMEMLVLNSSEMSSTQSLDSGKSCHEMKLPDEPQVPLMQTRL